MLKTSDPARVRDYTRRSKLRGYGLSEEDFAHLRVAQGNTCAICSRPFSDQPCVDHNHETGAMRGLLCSPCNAAIGLLGDSPGRLLAAASYLNARGSYAPTS